VRDWKVARFVAKAREAKHVKCVKYAMPAPATSDSIECFSNESS
jgi:hypothetical protein